MSQSLVNESAGASARQSRVIVAAVFTLIACSSRLELLRNLPRQVDWLAPCSRSDLSKRFARHRLPAGRHARRSAGRASQNRVRAGVRAARNGSDCRCRRDGVASLACAGASFGRVKNRSPRPVQLCGSPDISCGLRHFGGTVGFRRRWPSSRPGGLGSPRAAPDE